LFRSQGNGREGSGFDISGKKGWSKGLGGRISKLEYREVRLRLLSAIRSPYLPCNLQSPWGRMVTLCAQYMRGKYRVGVGGVQKTCILEEKGRKKT
jgi:hypothetical protein